MSIKDSGCGCFSEWFWLNLDSTHVWLLEKLFLQHEGFLMVFLSFLATSVNYCCQKIKIQILTLEFCSFFFFFFSLPQYGQCLWLFFTLETCRARPGRLCFVSRYCQADAGWGWRSRLGVITCSQQELLLLPPFLSAHFLPVTCSGRRPEGWCAGIHGGACYCCRHVRARADVASWPGMEADTKPSQRRDWLLGGVGPLSNF